MNHNMKVWKVLVIDDHPLIREGLRHLLEGATRYQIVGEGQNGREALELLEKVTVDLVLLDLNMPEMDGLEACRQIKQRAPAVKVLVLSMWNEAQKIRQVMTAGAQGYLLKSTTEKELMEAIDTVMAGNQYFSHDATQAVMKSLTAQHIPAESLPLTKREKEVLRLILQQFTNAEIAEKLFISPRTVDAHKRNLLEKTNAKNLAGLVIYGLQHGLMDDT